ncbi:uncharacterized protein LOC117344776 [Pecten maximus]|uniref:uncharacterized protein LOC117344776 n=1 Tax=Pecten maximus TaxID=6579 RepID=UPI00145845F3|nr:uncharacterized protein LOC117344776 [Pecten maximus]
MKQIFLVFFFATVGALTRPGPPLISKRVLRVAPAANYSLYQLSSNTGIPNHGICAKYCKSEECLSFSYTVGEQTCETYSRLIEETSDADIAMSTMYFSRVVLRSCADVPHMYHSGVYKITTTEQIKLDVYCDMDTADGPWTVSMNPYEICFTFTNIL